MSTQKLIVVDGENQILGRLASEVSKLLLEGNRVIVINAERILLTGNRKSNLNHYLSKLKISSRTNPIYGPYHARRPENIVTKTVRGMLPMRKSKGAIAFDRLRVFVGTPTEFEKASKTTFLKAKATKPFSFYIKIEEVAEVLGKGVAD